MCSNLKKGSSALFKLRISINFCFILPATFCPIFILNVKFFPVFGTTNIGQSDDCENSKMRKFCDK